MAVFIEYLVASLILLGASFALIGSIGLAKLPDFFRRVHGPTKATTLGVGGMILGSVLFFTAVEQTFQFQEFLISLFLFITAPASAYIITKAALHLKVQHEAEYIASEVAVQEEKKSSQENRTE